MGDEKSKQLPDSYNDKNLNECQKQHLGTMNYTKSTDCLTCVGLPDHFQS